MENLENQRIEEIDNQTQETGVDYVSAINELKKNTVSKERYSELEAENKKLLNSLINGDPYKSVPEHTAPDRIKCLKKYKENNFSSNLEFWKNFLDLREATIVEYGKDPIVTGSYNKDTEGHSVEASYGEEDAMVEQMDIIKNCIDNSNNDPETFNLLMRQASK